MTLTVPARIERELKTRAKSAYPRETFCYCLGVVAGDQVYIDELWWPDDVDRHCTASSVDIQHHWIVEARESALESGIAVVGDAHSHIGRAGVDVDRSLSEVDHDCSDRLSVAGVCKVEYIQSGARRTLRASLRWWGPTLPLTVRRIP